MTAKELYDRDFFEWTRCNAALLRAGRFDQADVDHIAEEIEDMGISQRRELFHRTIVVVAHLLKWKFQTERRSSSWERTLDTQRRKLWLLLRDMPSLRNALAENLGELYPMAVRDAAKETRLPKNTFPPACPFTLDQILDEEFFPE